MNVVPPWIIFLIIKLVDSLLFSQNLDNSFPYFLSVILLYFLNHKSGIYIEFFYWEEGEGRGCQARPKGRRGTLINP